MTRAAILDLFIQLMDFSEAQVQFERGISPLCMHAATMHR